MEQIINLMSEIEFITIIIIAVRFTTSVNKLNNTISNLQNKLDELDREHSNLKKQVFKNKENLIRLEISKNHKMD